MHFQYALTFSLYFYLSQISHGLLLPHRLSTIVNADSILVVRDGRVVEQGTHTELLGKVGGMYSQLVCKQVDALETANTICNEQEKS